MGLFLTAVVVAEHKVSTGETIDSIAQANGFSGQELAQFNWNTSDSQQINRCLVEIVGCTKKTKDGKNYVFDSSDDPGIVWVPQKWHQAGLPVDDTHTIRVLPSHCMIIRLVDDRDHPIPDTPYKVTFEDGSVRQGSLGRAGLALIHNPPPGLFSVFYSDHDDIMAKSLAGYSHDAFLKNDTGEVFALLQHPPQTIQATFAAYEQYYNDISGQGWLADMRNTVTDKDALSLAEAMLAYNNIENSRGVEIIQRLDVQNQV
jgi:hypothetical protein